MNSRDKIEFYCFLSCLLLSLFNTCEKRIQWGSAFVSNCSEVWNGQCESPPWEKMQRQSQSLLPFIVTFYCPYHALHIPSIVTKNLLVLVIGIGWHLRFASVIGIVQIVLSTTNALVWRGSRHIDTLICAVGLRGYKCQDMTRDNWSRMPRDMTWANIKHRVKMNITGWHRIRDRLNCCRISDI